MHTFSWRNLFVFVLLVLMQVLLFNNVRISGYINPQVYVFFILMLSVHTRGYVLLLTAFLLGIVVDSFNDSLAIHTMATLLMAFFRPAVLRLLLGNVSLEGIEAPSFHSFGTVALFVYIFILVILHHLALFFLEIFRFSELTQTLSRVIASSGVTIIFVVFAFAVTENSAMKKGR